MRILLFLPLLAACSPSPLYTPRVVPGAVTSGEVPRDARGEPVWSAIRPAPAVPMPTQPEAVPPGAGAAPPTPPTA